MKKLRFHVCIVFLLTITLNAFGQDETKTYFLPGVSYKYTFFDEVQLQNITSSLNIVRYNPLDRDNLLFFSLGYNPDILKTDRVDYPDLYHNISLSFMKRSGNHSFTASYMPRTEKPAYGGSYSNMGMAIYTYNIIKKDDFSMNLGGGLFVMDFGVRMDNGAPWMVWPIPFVTFSWNYDWININLMPGFNFTFWPHNPFSIILRLNFNNYDASIRYRFFRGGQENEDRRTETISLGLGIKEAGNNMNTSDGRSYRIEYNAIYAAVNIFRMFEISGGWNFNGRDFEREIGWASVGDSINMFRSDNKNNIGNGFYISASFRISPF